MRTLTRFVAAVVTAAVVPACSVIASSVAHADPVATTATVLKVVDGDTVDIVDDVRGRLRIRLLGIDTPETKKPGYTVGCWGPQATEFAKSTLLGQRVAFVTDPSQGMYAASAGPWPTWTRPTVGITRSKRPARVLPIPTSITAIRRPSRRDCRCRTGGKGRHASAKRPHYHSDSSRGASAKPSRCARARPSVGAQYLRDGDVVAREFTGVAGGGAVYGWG